MSSMSLRWRAMTSSVFYISVSDPKPPSPVSVRSNMPLNRARENERTSIEESANDHGVSGQLRSEILKRVLVSGSEPSTLLKRLRGPMMLKLVEFGVTEPKLTSQQQQHLVIGGTRRSLLL